MLNSSTPRASAALQHHVLPSLDTRGAQDPSREDRSAIRTALIILAACACAGAGLSWFEGHCGFKLSDEGFLWYGAQRILHGELPCRDFLSYDPARYFWSAAFMALFHDNGIIMVRQATMAFAVVGLTVGVKLLHDVSPKKSWIVIAAVLPLLMLWMIPWHKLYDVTAQIMVVAAVVNLLRKKSPGAFAVAGAITGLVAVIGRQHALYAVASFALSLVMLAAQGGRINWRRSLGLWLGGCLCGYLPMLALFVFAPDYPAAFWQSVQFTLFRADPLSLPVPWPWLVASVQPFDFSRFALGSFYVLLLAFDGVGALLLARSAISRRPLTNPLLAGCAIVSLAYTHYCLSRAAAAHLAMGIFPLLIALMALAQQLKVRRALKVYVYFILIAGSALATAPLHPGYAARQNAWVPYSVGRDRLMVAPSTAVELHGIEDMIARYAPHRKVLATPFWPGVYAMLGEKSPLYDIYILAPQSVDYQLKEIREIEAFQPELILEYDVPLDGMNSRRFSSFRPLVHNYFRDRWQLVPSECDQPYLMAYRPPPRVVPAAKRERSVMGSVK